MEWSEKCSPREVIFELRLEMSRSQLLEELGESFLGQHQSLRWEKTGVFGKPERGQCSFSLFCSAVPGLEECEKEDTVEIG